MEAYGSYDELVASGVELMQLIKTREEEDERELFSVHGDEEEREDGEEGKGEREEMGGEEDVREELEHNVEAYPLVASPCSPHSPYKRKDILYITESESNLASYSTKHKNHYLSDDIIQVPPDATSIYSAPSMLSLHSAVEVESSRHEEAEVGGATLTCHSPPHSWPHLTKFLNISILPL